MDGTTDAPTPRRHRSPWRWVALAVILLVASGALVALVTVRKPGPAMSTSCQAARSRFVSWSNLTIRSLNSASDAMAHWDTLWNRWTAGQMTAQEQQAARAASNADTARSIAADRRARAAFESFLAARHDCAEVPKDCVAEFNVFKVAIAHERREATAVRAVYATATAQQNAWNAQQTGGSRTAVDTATSAHNAAERTLNAVLAEHHRVYAGFSAAQHACNAA